MGPPKKRAPKPNVDEKKRRINYFEYRWNATTESHYLFNPYTGETILHTGEDVVMSRLESMWAPKEDLTISSQASSLVLYSEFYASKQCGRRKFAPYGDDRQRAATCIGALIRGFIARQHVRKIFYERYTKVLCRNSGFYYYFDNWYPEADTSWFKPRLAMTDDIGTGAPEIDPDDYLKGEKYSDMNYAMGPIVKKSSIGKKGIEKVEVEAFFVKNEWRDQAVSRPDEIDLEETPLGSVIAWLEGIKATSLYIQEYDQMRAAISGNNWDKVIHYMKMYPDNLTNQIFGFFSFSKSEIPLDETSGVLDFAPAEVMEMCIEIIVDEPVEGKPPRSETLKVFAFYAFNNLLSIKAGRAEFINFINVTETGDERPAAIERYIKKRLDILTWYLTHIPTYVTRESNKGDENFRDVIRPTGRGCEITEQIFQSLAFLLHDPEIKESIALNVIDPVLRALEDTQEEGLCVLTGLQILYNLVFRNEAGQELIMSRDIGDLMTNINYVHSADPDVMYQSRRFELSMQDGGWMGYAEEELEAEMLVDGLGADLDTREAIRRKLQGLDIAEEKNQDPSEKEAKDTKDTKDSKDSKADMHDHKNSDEQSKATSSSSSSSGEMAVGQGKSKQSKHRKDSKRRDDDDDDKESIHSDITDD